MECSVCGGPVGLIGCLGNLAHLVCRDCGCQSSREVTKEDLLALDSDLDDDEADQELEYKQELVDHGQHERTDW